MKLPLSIEKRSLLHGVKAQSPERLSALGQGFYEKGQLSDAADFFAKGQNTSKLEALKQEAVSIGDTFLLLKLSRLLGEEPDATLVENCAQKAESLAKIRYAIMAYERLGNDEKVAELKESISEDLDIKAEAEQEDVFIPTSVEEIDEE